MGNIILIGYMGSGKTTVGKLLAGQKGYTFMDTDAEIEMQQNKSIHEIFDTDGEEVFRLMETELLERLAAQKAANMVIATGGGMPVREKNRMLLSALGTVVYLKATPQTIYNRVKNDTTRPLLQCTNLMKKICEMTTLREPAYMAAASLIVEVDELSRMKVADKILREAYL